MLLNILVKPVWLLMENVVQNEIGHEAFGLYAALYSFGFIFLVLSDLGINQYFTKEVASQPGLLKKILPGVTAFKISISGFYPLFMVFAGWVLGYNALELYYLFILCLVQSILQMILFFRAKFQAFQDFAYDSITSVLDKLLLLGIVFFLLTYKIDLNSFIIARLGAVIITMFVTGYFIINKYGWYGLDFNLKTIKGVIKASLPFALISLMYSVHEKVDQVMLERISGEHTAGLYAAAYRWVDAVMMYLWTILPLFFARFSHLNGNRSEQKNVFNMGMAVANLPIVFVCGFVFFYGDKLFWIFDNSSQTELYTMIVSVKILFVAVLVHGFLAIAGTFLTADGHTSFLNKMMLFSNVLNISLNFLFIPTYGAVAASLSTAISTAFLSLSYVWYIRKYVEVKISISLQVKMIFNTVLFVITIYLLDLLGIKWYWTMTIAGTVLLGLSYFTGVLKIMGLNVKSKKL